MTALLSWSIAASAQVPPVVAVTWARPVTFDAPVEWTLRADHPLVREGVLVELHADPSLSEPRQAGEPVLTVDGRPAWRFNWDYVGGCVVALLPGPVDLRTAAIAFGSAELPERIGPVASPPSAERLSASAVAAALTAGGPALVGARLETVHAVAMARVAACTSTPSDLRRAGIP